MAGDLGSTTQRKDCWWRVFHLRRDDAGVDSVGDRLRCMFGWICWRASKEAVCLSCFQCVWFKPRLNKYENPSHHRWRRPNRTSLQTQLVDLEHCSVSRGTNIWQNQFLKCRIARQTALVARHISVTLGWRPQTRLRSLGHVRVRFVSSFCQVNVSLLNFYNCTISLSAQNSATTTMFSKNIYFHWKLHHTPGALKVLFVHHNSPGKAFPPQMDGVQQRKQKSNISPHK